jgi:hypothetical protein
LLSFWRCIRSTIASSRALGLTVLGPGVIASSAETSFPPRIARRPSRPRTTPRSSTTKQVSQLLSSSCLQTSCRRSPGRQVGTSVRTWAPARFVLPFAPSSGSPALPSPLCPRRSQRPTRTRASRAATRLVGSCLTASRSSTRSPGVPGRAEGRSRGRAA